MDKWNYGNRYLAFPIENGTAVFANGSRLKTHDIFSPLPSFMYSADLIFVDPPWNKGNLSSFYTKADMCPPEQPYQDFYRRLFACIKEINPKVAYVEIGKDFLADFILEMRNIFKYVHFYNSTYYHNKDNLCYIVRGAKKFKHPKLDGMDEEDIITWVCAHEDYDCIADPCMGQGLVAVNAFKNRKQFVGTELNHKRLSVTLARLNRLGAEYKVQEDDC